jgi:hypothetical protein
MYPVIFASFLLLLLMGLVKNITDRNTGIYIADNRMPVRPPVQVTACAMMDLLVSSRGQFHITTVYLLLPRILRFKVLVSSRNKFSDVKVVYHAAEEKSKDCSVELGPRYLGSVSFCGAAQWVKLSESWKKIRKLLFPQNA